MANILLISYDNSSHIPFFPVNIFYLTGHLKKRGHTVGLWPQDIHHGRDEALLQVLKAPWDIVGIGAVAGYYQYRKLKSLSQVVNRSPRRKKFHFVLGGHGPAAEPEFFMRVMGADSVVVGDGEDGFDQIFQGKKGVIHAKPCAESAAPLQSYNDFSMEIYRLIRWPTANRTDFCFPILSSRGCKWACSFCYRMREGYFMRPVEAIVEEIRFLHENFLITHFQFADELLMASEERTVEICEALLRLSFSIKWDCNGRLNYATPEVLRLMRRSGGEYVNYGIESLNQGLLNRMHKGLTVAKIEQGVRATLQAGLSPGLNLIWGFEGDTVANLRAAVDFICEHDPCHELRTIRPVTPYPGTELYRLAIEKGILEGPEDFYERKHVNSDLFSVNFMYIPTREAHRALYQANMELVANYLEKRKGRQIDQAARLYLEGDVSFRGYREV